MHVVANQYNYATPLSSAVGFSGEQSLAQDKKYFTLTNNTLDGSYYPISGDVGLWSTVISDANGALSEPFIVTVNDDLTINAFTIIGSAYAYPVDFEVIFYNADTVVRSIVVSNNINAVYTEYFSSTIVATSYTVTVSKISAANSTARLLNVYNPGYVRRSDALPVYTREVNRSSTLHTLHLYDALNIDVSSDRPAITNTIDTTHDSLTITHSPASTLTNVHTRMKDASRRIYGKVYITYTDPMLESTTEYLSSGAAYNSGLGQIADGRRDSDPGLFMLYDNDLSGSYRPISSDSHVGWMSTQLSGPGGVFNTPAPYVEMRFSERPVVDLSIAFDDSRGALVKDFTVDYHRANGEVISKSFVDNELNLVTIQDRVTNVVAVVVTVTRISREGYPAVILDIPIMSTLLYVGYKDVSDLISIDMLEELTYDDDVEALGGISANEVTVVLDNSNKDFFFNNPNSLIAGHLKRNRKIVPWLGVEVVPGEIEWYTLGTYWSYKWDVPVEGMTASVIGFDTIGLLDTTSFTEHQTLVDNSIGQLVEYVLEDAKKQLDFIQYKIDAALYNIRIPYAWFEAASHTAALRRISGCYPLHIYCDRNGVICAAPQKLRLDYHYDTWSNSTNVISKSYSSLYTTLPNIINVTVSAPSVVTMQSLAADTLTFDVAIVQTRTLSFDAPYVSDLSVVIDCDDTVQYTYAVYSWGIEFEFAGTGIVRSIECTGSALLIDSRAVITHKDANSVRINGAVTRDISSDFIQTSELASMLIARLLELSEYDKYDASVDYRGDIALSINDPILLRDGIAPTERYNIKRHELFWNGSLSGSAYLNT